MRTKAVIFNHNQRTTAEVLYQQLVDVFDTAFFDSGSREDQISALSTHKFDNLYWTGCWNKAWELYGDYDVIWGIGGDCTLLSEPHEYLSAIESLYPFGSWSPVIRGRAHGYMQPTNEKKTIFSVHYLEGIAFALSRDLWEVAGPLDPSNHIGHAQDLICCFLSRRNELKNILDGRVQLSHPPSDQYDLEEARELMFASLERKFGSDWSDVMDWWWGRGISFLSNTISRIEVKDGKKCYANPFPIK